MEVLIPGVIASEPRELPFDPSLDVRSFVLQRERGNVLVYQSETLRPDADTLEDLGGIKRQYLNHHHEAGPGANWVARRFSAPLLVHADDAEPASWVCHVTYTYSRRHTLDDDLEVIPTPGHTPGATALLWRSGDGARVLFTGDTIYLRDGEWVAAVLNGVSDRAAYLESLDLLRELDFDVLVPWASSRGEPAHAPTDARDARRRIGAILDRVWAGADH